MSSEKLYVINRQKKETEKCVFYGSVKYSALENFFYTYVQWFINSVDTKIKLDMTWLLCRQEIFVFHGIFFNMELLLNNNF